MENANYAYAGSVFVAKIWVTKAGLLAFNVNFLRELVAFGLVPLIANYCRFTAIALFGAIAADTTLPTIAKSMDAEGALVGLINGAIITASVLILLALFSNWAK
ncbi:MAG: lysine exporter LysO family protein [Armatimonadetes bacterium]|nr:lysine exporter LysO family protein [Armatimonadota bacterium]MDW8029112.1 LysO family transporter [Armatimonadota bacterium]